MYGVMHRVIYRDDPENIMGNYIQQVQAGKVDIAGPIPEDVLDVLKTAMPADFNNSSDLEWRYVIRKGWVWQIDEAPADYMPSSEDEAAAIELVSPEHRNN